MTLRTLAVALALAGLPVLAGCLSDPDVEGAAADLPAAASSALRDATSFAHAADGSLLAAAALPGVAGALFELGVPAFEPTLGVAPDGAIYYAATRDGVAVGFEPLVMKSVDGGLTWTDVSPRLPTGQALPPETNDPYLYVDPATGRVFQFAMAPILVCSVLSWSDDGGATWTTNPRGCGNTPPWDHQTLVAAKPRAVQTVGYANVVHQCVNEVAASWCSRSLDGGLTWTPGAPAFVGLEPCGPAPSAEDPAPVAGGLHGHLVAAPDGTVYLPKTHCGRPMLAVTEDDGTTWATVQASDEASVDDPAMAVDDAGNVYFLYATPEGRLRLVASADAGRTWSAPVAATPEGMVGHLPAIAAAGVGRVAIAYPGTLDLPQGYDSSEKAQAAAGWHGFLAVSVDALSPEATFLTARVNPVDDPLVRGPCGPGRCPGMTDFIDVVIGPDGKPYAAFVDVCADACAGSADEENNVQVAVMGTLAGGPALRDAAVAAQG